MLEPNANSDVRRKGIRSTPLSSRFSVSPNRKNKIVTKRMGMFQSGMETGRRIKSHATVGTLVKVTGLRHRFMKRQMYLGDYRRLIKE